MGLAFFVKIFFNFEEGRSVEKHFLPHSHKGKYKERKVLHRR
jgi:hypothetical protein